MRETSLDAYRTIEANGMLSRRRWEVYSYTFHNGPTTAKRAWRALAPQSNSGVITTRFSELQERGVLKDVGQEVDEDSGMMATLWDVTADLPRKVDSKAGEPTKREVIVRLATFLARALREASYDQKHNPWRIEAVTLLKYCAKFKRNTDAKDPG